MVNLLLCLVFFITGISALIFEMLWFQLAGLCFGNSVYASAIVFAAFMGGIGFGNTLSALYGEKINHPLRLYALLEIFVAVSGLSIVLLFPNLTKVLSPLFKAISDDKLLLNTVRFPIAFLIMAVPTTAMGATLPVLVKTMLNKKSNFGSVLGILYGINTLGATVGVITCERYLLKFYGIKGAGRIAFCLNLTAAFAALLLSSLSGTKQGQGQADEGYRKPAKFNFTTCRILLTASIAGFALMALEVLWFRFIILFQPAHAWNFAIMLATVLAGISIGGLLAASLFRLEAALHRHLRLILLINGILVVILYGNFHFIIYLFSPLSSIYRIFGYCVFLIFPVALFSGVIFTLLGHAYYLEIGRETRAAGFLTFANTVGGMLGSVAGGFFLIPVIGIEGSFWVIACLYGGIALFIFPLGVPHQKRPFFNRHRLVAALFIIAIVFFPFGLMDKKYLFIPYARFLQKGEKRVAVKEGVTETLQYLRQDLMEKPYYYRLVTNSHSMTSTSLPAKRYMKLFAYWPMIFHPHPQKALLICYGLGSTAKALTDIDSLEQIDIVDISKDIVQMSPLIYPDAEENPTKDPRTTIHIEDGRFFLQTAVSKYDIITAEPPPPAFNGIVNLYTRDYFKLIRSRLADGGMTSYWLPVYQLKTDETKAILKAFCDAFPNCSLWTAEDLEWMLVGIKEGQDFKFNDDLYSRWKEPFPFTELNTLGLDCPARLSSLFIADGRQILQWVGQVPPLTDNFPRRLSYGDHDRNQYKKNYREFMDKDASFSRFKDSPLMKSLWPEDILSAAQGYFAVRQDINDMLAGALQPVEILTRCTHRPLLEPFLFWAFGNQMSLEIVESKLREGQLASTDFVDLHVQLASRSLKNNSLDKAEYHLEKAMSFIPPETRPKDLYLARLYLLTLMGQKDKIKALKHEFLNQKRIGVDGMQSIQ